jgi:hypothetical protein
MKNPLKTALLTFGLACAPALLHAEGGAHLHNKTNVTWYLDPIRTESCTRKPITSMAVRRVCGGLIADEIVNFAQMDKCTIEVSPGVQVYFVPLTFSASSGIQPHFDGELKAFAPLKHRAAFTFGTALAHPPPAAGKPHRMGGFTVQVTLQVLAPDPDSEGAMGIGTSESWADLAGQPLLEAGPGATTLDIDESEMGLGPFTLEQEKGSETWVLRPVKASGCCVIL